MYEDVPAGQVLDQDADPAARVLKALGLRVRVVAIPGPGTVHPMEPGAGSRVRKGSVVTLQVF